MYVSVIGYYVDRETKEPIYDGGLWMMYETNEVEKAVEDFKLVADDLLFSYQQNVDHEIEFMVDLIQPLDALPKMWKNRVVQKL